MTDSNSCLQARALFPKSKASEEQKERGSSDHMQAITVSESNRQTAVNCYSNFRIRERSLRCFSAKHDLLILSFWQELY